jgi:hypothetical protein
MLIGAAGMVKGPIGNFQEALPEMAFEIDTFHRLFRKAPGGGWRAGQRGAEGLASRRRGGCRNRPRHIAINGFALPGANSRSYFGAGTGVPVELFGRG